MTIRQILLSLPTFPDPPPGETLESACLLAQRMKASLTVRLAQLDSDPKTWPSAAEAFPIDARRMMGELVSRSETHAGVLAGAIKVIADEYGVALDLRRCLTTLYAPPDALIDLARLHDLVVLPVPESEAFTRTEATATIFRAGRPVLLLPSGDGARRLRGLGRVTVAWDYSRAAARALGDALPILRLAEKVHVVTVRGEKPVRTTATQSDLEKFLSRHAIKHVVEEVALDDGRIAEALARAAETNRADLLVMGAYGHSRIAELVLGGATRGVLARPDLPILLSH